MTAHAFLDGGPAPAGSDPLFGELRASEFARLDADDHAYLDFTGSGLYAERQITRHADRLRRSILGNPHSTNCPSLVSTAIIRDARAKLLQFLDASPSDYVVCFTANSSGAIKLVAESFPFGRDRELALSADNHNSMNGVREYARARGARVTYVGLDKNLRMSSPRDVIREMPRGSLFGFPAQSNFSGVKHPLSLVGFAQRRGILVLLDAAAFLPTNALSLRRCPADFVALSMYKIAGYPTGVGALVARKDSLSVLRRPWFAGGTVEYASVQNSSHLLRADGGEGFEDGTPAFLDIAAVSDSLDFLLEIGMSRIARHVSLHTCELIRRLEGLRTKTGKPLVQIYGPPPGRDRGATVAFNVMGRDGHPIPFGSVVDRARNEGVSLRGGCFCNPGAAESAFQYPAGATSRCFRELGSEAFTIDRFANCLGRGVPVGAVRASLGVATNQRDIERAVSVVATFG